MKASSLTIAILETHLRFPLKTEDYMLI